MNGERTGNLINYDMRDGEGQHGAHFASAGGTHRGEDSVAIYPNASGPPTVYKADGGGYFLYCTYDGNGNLLRAWAPQQMKRFGNFPTAEAA